MSDAIEIIRQEHRNIDRVLAALQDAVDGLSAAEPKPDLEPLFSIVYYIRVFPDRLHHPKEEEFLFKALRRRSPQSAATLDELERQHDSARTLIDELDRALKDADRDWPDGLAALREAAETYITFQREHIGLEEREVMPRARECLKPADWGAIDRAFASNLDPLFGENLEAGFRALFARIMRGGGPATSN